MFRVQEDGSFQKVAFFAPRWVPDNHLTAAAFWAKNRFLRVAKGWRGGGGGQGVGWTFLRNTKTRLSSTFSVHLNA